jgi:hypothetical protein
MTVAQNLPTPLALVARRLGTIGLGASADTFLHTSYLAECAIKSIAAVLYAGLREGSPDDAYRVGHYLIQADGLGNWDTAIRLCTNQPIAGFLPREFQQITIWATKKRVKSEEEWFIYAKDALGKVLGELGGEDEATDKMSTARGLITSLVRIRNKTKAHGAVGQDFFAVANKPYFEAIETLIANCPIFSWTWLHIHCLERETRYTLLSGNDPRPEKAASSLRLQDNRTGIYVIPHDSSKAFYCTDLIGSNIECSSFRFSNGGFTPQGQAEFIDYSSGKTSRVDASAL